MSKDSQEAQRKQVEKQRIKVYKSQLAQLQQPLRAAKLPVIVVFEGFSASGKGEMIGEIISQLDARGYAVHAMPRPTPEEERMPFLAPFWKKLPARGEITIFDHSWYSWLLRLPKKDRKKNLEAIQIFERQLADDGCLVLKFFLSIDQKEQRHRLETLESDDSSSWRVAKSDWKQNKKHQDYSQQIESLIASTDALHAPWIVVDNNQRRSGTLQVLEALNSHLNCALQRGVSPSHSVTQRMVISHSMPLLDEVDLNHSVTDEEYSIQLKEERQTLQRLHGLIYQKKIPVILAFEGWDAAGKGGAIRRLSWALDPRGFNVFPISAPSPDEFSHHYLCRFWNRLPKDGHIAIFDRTWYGRVMVERLESLTPEHRWQAAYQEINEFETELTNWGAIVLKFWIHIDAETQLSRFTDRQNTPEKQYKLTDEDWRNREKWEDYEQAINEMLQRTSSLAAPWIIVEGNDKRYARLKVLRTVRQALEARLEAEA